MASEPLFETITTSCSNLPLEITQSGFPTTRAQQFERCRDWVRIPADGSEPYIDLVRLWSSTAAPPHDQASPLAPGDKLIIGEHPLRWEAWGGEELFETGIISKGGFRVLRRGRPWLLGRLPESWKKEHPLGVLPYQRDWLPGEVFAEVIRVSEPKEWENRKGRPELAFVEVRILATNELRAFTFDQVFRDAFVVVVPDEAEV